MDFVLVRVAVVLDERSRDRDVRPRLRNVERVVEEGARRLRVRLSDRIPAHDLEYEISALVGSVAVVDEITERRIDTKPPVRVAVGLVPYSIARRMRAVRRRIDENPGHCDASFVDDEPLRIVYVLPQLSPQPANVLSPGTSSSSGSAGRAIERKSAATT